jgi:two-component system response regulator FixJ
MQHTQTKDVSFAPIVHVVDDDEAVLDSVSMLLDSIGLTNSCYNNAQVFLDAYNKTEFDKHNGCILLDIRMP